MSKYIQINESQISNLSTNRLLNIFRKNRRYLFCILNQYGFDTSNNGNNINWFIVDDNLYHHKEYSIISSTNDIIKIELNKRNKNENDNRA